MKLENRKESMTGVSKPDITHVRKVLMTYTARGCGYGDYKYQRGNYLRGPFTPKAAREYLRATISHLTSTLDAIELHQAQDPELTDLEGAKAAFMTPDTQSGRDCEPSNLPHLALACSSLNMALETARLGNLIDADPGAPWLEATPEITPFIVEVSDRSPMEWDATLNQSVYATDYSIDALMRDGHGHMTGKKCPPDCKVCEANRG